MPKIQEMLDKIPTPISGATCNEKTGWLPPNFDDNCREILTDTINELVEQQPPDFDLSTIASTSKAAMAKVETLTNTEQDWEYAVSRPQSNNFDGLIVSWLKWFSYYFIRKTMKHSTNQPLDTMRKRNDE